MSRAIVQSAYYACGLVLMKGVSFLMLPVVARALSTHEYGMLDLWVSLLNVGSIVIGFGLIEALYKNAGDLKQDQLNALLSTATLQQIGLAALLCLFFAASAIVFYSLSPIFHLADGLLVIATLFISACINIPLSWLRLIDNAKTFFWLTGTKAVVQAALTFYFLSLGWGVTGVLLSGFLSALLLASALIFLQHNAMAWRWQTTQATALFRYGVPLIGSGLLLFVAAGAERWILAGTLGLDALAQYALAMQFALMVAFMCEPFSLWWFPKRFQILKQAQGDLQTARIAEGICHLSLWFAMILASVGSAVIVFWFPERYHSAAQWLPWLALAIAFKQMSHVLNTGCYQGKTTTLVLKINAWMALFAIILFTIGSLQWGLLGTVMACVLLFAIRALVFFCVSQHELRLPHDRRSLLLHIGFISLSLALGNTTDYLLFAGLALQTLGLIYWSKKRFGNNALTASSALVSSS